MCGATLWCSAELWCGPDRFWRVEVAEVWEGGPAIKGLPFRDLDWCS